MANRRVTNARRAAESRRDGARQAARTARTYRLSESRRAALRIIALALIIILLIIIAASSFRQASIASQGGGSGSFWSHLGPGKGYPYDLDSSTVDAVGVLDGNLFVLKDNKTLTLNSTAKEIKTAKHSYGRPAMNICGSRALVYDRGGVRYRIETRSKILHSGKLQADESIITAAVGKKGNLAFGTLCDRATSRLVVLNKKASKRVFVWDCANYTVNSVALSDNGKYAAVSVIGSEGAVEYSKVFVFDFDYKEPLYEGEFPGNTILSVHFADNNDVVAVGDTGIAFIRGLSKSTLVKYGDNTLSAFAFASNGETVLVEAKYGSMNSQSLVGYRPSGKEAFRKAYDEEIKGLSTSDSRIGVLTSDSVDLSGFNGYLHKKVSANSNSLKALIVGNRVYVYEMGSIEKAHHVSRKT